MRSMKLEWSIFAQTDRGENFDYIVADNPPGPPSLWTSAFSRRSKLWRGFRGEAVPAASREHESWQGRALTGLQPNRLGKAVRPRGLN
jgi:hypothetical protein